MPVAFTISIGYFVHCACIAISLSVSVRKIPNQNSRWEREKIRGGDVRCRFFFSFLFFFSHTREDVGRRIKFQNERARRTMKKAKRLKPTIICAHTHTPHNTHCTRCKANLVTHTAPTTLQWTLLRFHWRSACNTKCDDDVFVRSFRCVNIFLFCVFRFTALQFTLEYFVVWILRSLFRFHRMKCVFILFSLLSALSCHLNQYVRHKMAEEGEFRY